MNAYAWICDECGMKQKGEHGPNTLCSRGAAAADALGWGRNRGAAHGRFVTEDQIEEILTALNEAHKIAASKNLAAPNVFAAVVKAREAAREAMLP